MYECVRAKHSYSLNILKKRETSRTRQGMFVILLVGRLRQGNANSQPGWATYQDPVLKNRTKLQ